MAEPEQRKPAPLSHDQIIEHIKGLPDLNIVELVDPTVRFEYPGGYNAYFTLRRVLIIFPGKDIDTGVKALDQFAQGVLGFIPRANYNVNIRRAKLAGGKASPVQKIYTQTLPREQFLQRTGWDYFKPSHKTKKAGRKTPHFNDELSIIICQNDEQAGRELEIQERRIGRTELRRERPQ